MKRYLSICLAVAALVTSLVSCSKDGPYAEDMALISGDYRSNPASIADGAKINAPVWISGKLPKDFSEAVGGRVSQTASSAGEAMVVVTDMDGYAALDTVKDRIVIVYKPSDALLGQLGAAPGGDVLCVAVQQSGSGKCVVTSPADGLEVDEGLNGLVAWTNDTVRNSTADFDPSSFWEESCLYTTYSDKVREQITNVVASKKDYLEGTFVVDVQLKVTPMHGFKTNNSEAMDYYFVSSTVSVASGKMYTGNFTKKHGGVKARICGFYLKSLSAEFVLYDPSEAMFPYFVQVPCPDNVIGSTSYTTGWNVSLGGGITGGTTPMASSTTGVTVSSSTARSISDCDVLSAHRDATVTYDYVVNNLPRLKSSHITDPPLVSTSTVNFYSQWVWAVRASDYDMKKVYNVHLNLSNLVYGASYFYTGSIDYHDLEFLQKEYEFIWTLPRPNRAPTGQFRLTNSEEGTFLTNIKLTNKTHTDAGEYNDKSVYGQGGACSLFVIAGEYDLQCDIKGKDGSTKTCTYSGPVNVTPGGTVKLSTGYGFK